MKKKRYIRIIVLLLLSSLLLTVALYLLFALLFTTDSEKVLERENEAYRQLYSKLKPEEELLGDVITALQLKDAGIYKSVFHSEAPNVDPVGKLNFLFGSDSIPDRKIVKYSFNKAEDLCRRAESVEASFDKVMRFLSSNASERPPMTLPLRNLTYPQVGAGPGMKFNPFFGMLIYHNGLDLIAPQGTPVHASASGVVENIRVSSKGRGREVEIRHQGQYFSSYAHLSEIEVKKGQKVERGQIIGKVGMSGNAFAPHLHYEIKKDSLSLNPINYIFASVDPQEYSNMLFMSSNTRQSMD